MPDSTKTPRPTPMAMKAAEMPPDLTLDTPAGALGPVELTTGGCCGPVRGDGVSVRLLPDGPITLTNAQTRELHAWLGRVIAAFDAGWKPTLPDWMLKDRAALTPPPITQQEQAEP